MGVSLGVRSDTTVDAQAQKKQKNTEPTAATNKQQN